MNNVKYPPAYQAWVILGRSF